MVLETPRAEDQSRDYTIAERCPKHTGKLHRGDCPPGTNPPCSGQGWRAAHDHAKTRAGRSIQLCRFGGRAGPRGVASHAAFSPAGAGRRSPAGERNRKAVSFAVSGRRDRPISDRSPGRVIDERLQACASRCRAGHVGPPTALGPESEQSGVDLFSTGRITIFMRWNIGVADWPYGHRVGGEQTSCRPMLAQLFWSNLDTTRRTQRR